MSTQPKKPPKQLKHRTGSLAFDYANLLVWERYKRAPQLKGDRE
jgi:hypothetical protein